MSAPTPPFRSEPNNDPTNSSLPIDRLWEAADACLEAVKDVAQYTGGKRMSPLDILGSPLQPSVLAPFTKFEIEEATRFLERMGAVETRSNPARDN